MTGLTRAQVKGCFSKRRYSTKTLAETVRRRAENEREVRLRTYHCEFCHGFHLTKKGMSQNHATTLQPRVQVVSFSDRGQVIGRQEWRVE